MSAVSTCAFSFVKLVPSMRPRRDPRVKALPAILTAALMAIASLSANGGQPKIDRIEPFLNTPNLLIHFDTEPDRIYIVEYVTSLTATNWTGIYTTPPDSEPSHYVLFTPQQGP